MQIPSYSLKASPGSSDLLVIVDAADLTQSAQGSTKKITAGSLPSAWGGMTKVQATAVAGYTLINGTSTILSWTAPNDGLQHRALVIVSMYITTTETGGSIGWNFTMPNGQAASPTLVAGGSAAGTKHAIDAAIVEANTAVTVTQVAALTAGGPAVLWAEIWAS